MIWVGAIDEKFLATLLADTSKDLLLCSEGGQVDIMTAAMDHLRYAVKRNIHATGRIYSAALPILSCGLQRSCSPNTNFMFHGVRCRYKQEQTQHDLSREASQFERYDTLMVNRLGRVTSRPAKWWREKLQAGDYYFPAQEALAMGLVHYIAK